MAVTLRAETAGLVRLARRDMAALWRMVASGASAEVALRDLLPAIIETYGQAGAALAADWYDDQRDKAGVRGRFTAIPIEANDRGAQALIGWALTTATDDTSLATLVAGGVQRRIADHVRYTVANSSIADPQATGWQRVGTGTSTCTFCQMVNGRGAVFTEAAADFGAHDNDDCQAVPAFDGEPIPVKPYTVSPRRTIDPETGMPVIDADFIRAREWIADHS